MLSVLMSKHIINLGKEASGKNVSLEDVCSTAGLDVVGGTMVSFFES